ncbi:MAG TPA: adenylate/guanylate cyclase domain-containing protein [Candidatus Binatia bacterium]
MNSTACATYIDAMPAANLSPWSEGYTSPSREGAWERLAHALRDKIALQMDEIARISRLKRFVAPQIAETILNDEDAMCFGSHRREITVVFMDLRGFTAFTERAEPEEVLEALKAYHAEIGNLIVDSGGTLARFTGDGMMVFFNDPVPYADHAERAVAMTVKTRERMQKLRADWSKKGWELDLGAGIATGYAAVGNIGFAGRLEYTAIGSVMNLASRLCDEAKGGQILTTQKTLSKVEGMVEAEAVGELRLKGFSRPISVFNIKQLRKAA